MTYLFVCCGILFSVSNGYGQIPDSLLIVLKKAPHDTVRCAILNDWIEEESDDGIWPSYNDELEKIARKNLIGSEADKNVYLKYFAIALNNKGYLANSRGDIARSLDYLRQSLFVQEKINDKKGMAESFNNIGAIYKKQGILKKALEYYRKGLAKNEEINNKEGIATALNNIAGIYETRGDLAMALECYFRALKISEELEDLNSIALCLNNLGYINHRSGKLPEALVYFNKSLSIYEKNGDKSGIVNALSNISYLLAESGKPSEALPFATRAMALSKDLGFPESIKNSAQSLKKVYQKQNDYKNAIGMFELEIRMRDSIKNEQTEKIALENQIQYEFEKKEAIALARHKVELDKQRIIAEEKQRKQNIIITIVICGLLLVAGFAAYVFKILSVTRKQKAVIELKNREVEAKQIEILDSIHYAGRIQRALMPTTAYITKNLGRLKSRK